MVYNNIFVQSQIYWFYQIIIYIIEYLLINYLYLSYYYLARFIYLYNLNSNCIFSVMIAVLRIIAFKYRKRNILIIIFIYNSSILRNIFLIIFLTPKINIVKLF